MNIYYLHYWSTFYRHIITVQSIHFITFYLRTLFYYFMHLIPFNSFLHVLNFTPSLVSNEENPCQLTQFAKKIISEPQRTQLGKSTQDILCSDVSPGGNLGAARRCVTIWVLPDFSHTLRDPKQFQLQHPPSYWYSFKCTHHIRFILYSYYHYLHHTNASITYAIHAYSSPTRTWTLNPQIHSRIYKHIMLTSNLSPINT